MEKILNDIRIEQEYSDKKWGTEFDDKNTVNDWCSYINIYLANATTMKATKEEQRKAMVKVANLAVSALRAFDRNNGFALRHYDKY